MNQRSWQPTEHDSDHPRTSAPRALERVRPLWLGAARRGVVVGLGIAKDAYDEVMSCFGAAVACGDDFARSAMRFRRKLAARLTSAEMSAPSSGQLATVTSLRRAASAGSCAAEAAM